MSASERKITPTDILTDTEYAAHRAELRAKIIAVKKNRRMEVGPFATFTFENYDTMWLQVMEMLRIEKGGAGQIEGELETYNPLIGQGRELIATLMLEIEEPRVRDRALLTLGGIEETVYLEIGQTRIKAAPTEYGDRRTARPRRCTGCASSSRRTRSRAFKKGASGCLSASPTPITGTWR
jgi:hypothetical protein